MKLKWESSTLFWMNRHTFPSNSISFNSLQFFLIFTIGSFLSLSLRLIVSHLNLVLRNYVYKSFRFRLRVTFRGEGNFIEVVIQFFLSFSLSLKKKVGTSSKTGGGIRNKTTPVPYTKKNNFQFFVLHKL